METLSTIEHLVYSKAMELENDVFEICTNFLNLNEQLVKANERRLVQQERIYSEEKWYRHLEKEIHSKSRNLQLGNIKETSNEHFKKKV